MNLCLLLHGLGPPPSVPEAEVRYWLPAETFAKIVEFARHTATRITFDDGNDTDVRIALPILKAAGLSASFFIPTDRIGQPGYVSEADIRTLRAAGMTIGSHGCAHIIWTAVSNEEIADDVTRSIEKLSSILDEKVDTVAVPFGECDRRVLRMLQRLGVRRVYTSFRGPAAEGAWLVRRDCITVDMAEASIRELFTKKYTAADAMKAFLRAWRHAGRAALWRAN